MNDSASFFSKKSKIYIFLILIGFLSFVLSACIKSQEQKFLQDEKVAKSLKQGKLDYYFDDISIYKYDKKGEPESLLKSINARVYRGSDKIHLKKINYTFLQKPKWNLSADYGVSDEKSSLIEIEKNVKILIDDKKNPNTRITTSNLKIDFKKNLATNKVHTKITNPDLILTGKGISLDLSSQKVELQADVIGIYKP